MSRIIKNKTVSDIAINDIGITVPASSTYDLTLKNRSVIANSDNLMLQIALGNIVYMDGETEVTGSHAIRFLTDYPESETSKSSDCKLIVQQTPRVFGTTTCFFGKGDDPSSPEKINGGTELFVQHKIGDDMSQSKYYDFNTIQNKTYIHSGYIQWKNTNWDIFNIYLVPKVTSINVEGTGFRHYNNYILMPEAFGAGYGPIVGLSGEAQLVEVFRDSPWHASRQGFWDADYDTVTHTWSNLRPNLAASGRYNIFTYEVNMFKFANNLRMVGTSTGYNYLYCYDTEGIGHGMRMKTIFTTNGDDHDWDCFMFLTLYREKTC